MQVCGLELFRCNCFALPIYFRDLVQASVICLSLAPILIKQTTFILPVNWTRNRITFVSQVGQSDQNTLITGIGSCRLSYINAGFLESFSGAKDY